MSFPSSSDVSFHVGQRMPLALDNRMSTSRILAGRHSRLPVATPALVPTLLRTGRGDRFCSRAKTQKTRQYFTSNLFLWQAFGSHGISTKCLKQCPLALRSLIQFFFSSAETTRPPQAFQQVSNESWKKCMKNACGLRHDDAADTGTDTS